MDFHLEKVHQTAKELTWICHNDLRSWQRTISSSVSNFSVPSFQPTKPGIIVRCYSPSRVGSWAVACDLKVGLLRRFHHNEYNSTKTFTIESPSKECPTMIVPSPKLPEYTKYFKVDWHLIEEIWQLWGCEFTWSFWGDIFDTVLHSL